MPNPTNKVHWTNEMVGFLKANHHLYNSRQLAEMLGIGRTSTRTKCYQLGLYKMELEYWKKEQLDYLLQHYKTIGDTELAFLFNQRWKKIKAGQKSTLKKSEGS